MEENAENQFELKFTGKAVLIVDLEDFSPMSISFNDKELLTEVIRLITAGADLSDVSASTPEMDEQFTNILQDIS
jgi:hypothetical protein